MRRREFITLLGGAAAWPLAARAQQPERMRRIGVLMSAVEGDQRGLESITAFAQGLAELGWTVGRNVRIEYRWGAGDLDRFRRYAAELIALSPDVVLATAGSIVGAFQQASRTVPIVFVTTIDPVAFGLVQSLSHPGGNVTGLTNFAEELASKQLDIIRALLPHVTRVGALVNVENPLHVPQWRETQAAVATAALALVRFDYRVPADLERAFDQFAREKVEALLVPPDVTFVAYRVRIAELAAKAQLPAIYFSRSSVQAGGLLSYGPNLTENYRRAAVFVDKILKGAKPADLPVERPTKIELVINLKTAKALGLDVPPTLLARADEVIE
jgi:putative tryptophan/tyrosine transport system substrate-binding protein